MLPDTPLSAAIAGGAIVGPLLDILIAKGIVSHDEVRSILTSARSILANASSEDAIEGARIISERLQTFADQ
jgi:hypothetical protein